MKLSKRALSVKPSLTLEISAMAGEMKKKGVDIVNLSAGEPDFNTPDFICDAAKKAIDSHFTRYTNVRGIPELRQAVARKIKQTYGIDYDPEQILISNGAKQSLYNFFQAVVNEGDDVLIPAPYWLSYPRFVELAGGVPVYMQTGMEEDFKISPEQLEKNIGEKTRGLILNSPSNPTGSVYTKQELGALGEVLRGSGLFVVSDDIYEHLIYTKERFCSILGSCPDLVSETMIIGGLSKSHCMTGWRVGFAAGPADVIGKMAAIQGHATSNINSIAQKAALSAYREGISFLSPIIKEFRERRDYIHSEINTLEGFHAKLPAGTFYLFVNVEEAMATLSEKKGADIKDSLHFSEMLLQDAHVAVVPGEVFGAPGYIRISFACSMENLRKAVQNIRNFLGS